MSETEGAPALRLEDGNIRRLLIDYSIPSIVGMIVVALYNIVDRIFIGQGVGPMAISGLTLTFPLMSLIAAVGTLVGIGAASRVSIVLGMKDIKWARNILGNAFVLTFFMSAILVTFSLLFLDEILVAFGGSDATIPYAESYLRIVIPFSVLTNLTYGFSNMIRASGFPRKSMYVLLLGVCVNVVLDPIFIFGFRLGIEGAAIATVISMAVSAVYAFSHFLNRSNPVHFRIRCMKPRRFIIRNIVSIGLAPFLMNIATSAVNIIMNNRLVVHGGDYAIGAYGIINSYATIVILCLLGLGQGMQPIVGYNYGAQKLKRMKDALLLAIKFSFIFSVPGFVLAETFPAALVRAFTSDAELTAIAVPGMRWAFLMIPIVGFHIMTSTFFQSISKPGSAIFMSLTRQFIFLIPSLFLLSGWLGLTGVWLSIPVADILAAIVAGMFLLHERRVFYSRIQSLLKFS